MRLADRARLLGGGGQTGDDALDSDLSLDAVRRVVARDLLGLGARELRDEVVDGDEAAAHLDLDLVSAVDLDEDVLRAEAIVTLRLADEEDLQVLTLRIVVEVRREGLVGQVALARDVDRRPLARELVVQLLDLRLGVPELGDELLDVLLLLLVEAGVPQLRLQLDDLVLELADLSLVSHDEALEVRVLQIERGGGGRLVVGAGVVLQLLDLAHLVVERLELLLLGLEVVLQLGRVLAFSIFRALPQLQFLVRALAGLDQLCGERRLEVPLALLELADLGGALADVGSQVCDFLAQRRLLVDELDLELLLRLRL